MPLKQAAIAFDLGIVLPPKERHLLPKSHPGYPELGAGTHIEIKRYGLTAFFKRRGYQLQEKYCPATDFRSDRQFKDFLTENLKKNNDLLICYHYPYLFCLEGVWGHASLIAAVVGKNVVLQDPDQKLERKISLHLLLEATRVHYHGGVWVISEI